jgi:hypothetical protein
VLLARPKRSVRRPPRVEPAVEDVGGAVPVGPKRPHDPAREHVSVRVVGDDDPSFPIPRRVASAAKPAGGASCTGTGFEESVKSERQSAKTAPGMWASR